MSGQFIPHLWGAPLLAQLQNAPMLPVGPQRRGHSVPPSGEELREYNEWVEQRVASSELGVDRGWIDEDGDVIGPIGTWVYDEPEDEYQVRLKEWQDQNTPDGVVTLRVHREEGTR